MAMDFPGLPARLAHVREMVARSQMQGGWKHPVRIVAVTKNPAAQMMATSGKTLAGGISCRLLPPRFVLMTGTRSGRSADVDTGGLSGDGNEISHAGNASVNGTTAAAAKMAAASTQWRNAADRPPRSAFSASPVRRMMDDRIARSPRSLIVIHP